MALASSTLAKSSRSCGGMQHSTLGQRGVHHRSLHSPPFLCIALADDNNIERHAERTKCTTETHHLGVTVARVALYDEEIEIAVRARITTCPRAKQHDLDRIVGDSRQRLTGSLDDILSNHGDTVAKPSDQGAEP
jgi:hypothetical protein